ncbi:GNAT family N-acetyltransferase [uncultured Veillonella sp.]|uniref:GNAT family N-acetyltransferase n=1 Tax=uncultured Veillonella sp. TaxID=159268 RepID=UPI0026057D1D|nr:GNAT family N-acetyltransferase [uncultured Veillonella sp.]
MREILIRSGVREDIPALLEIYNYEVLNGVATFDIEPRTIDEWTTWYEDHNTLNHPLLVATIGDSIAGYATLSAYRSKEAYASTVELSIYVGPTFRKQGVATKLMEHILNYAKEDSATHVVVSVITAGNKGSVTLHEKFGFTYSGVIPEVGVKNAEFLGIVNYYLLV